ncbi:MAG: hypothetical protein WCQ99_13295, partial [Pseudomonadota bacterium]
GTIFQCIFLNERRIAQFRSDSMSAVPRDLEPKRITLATGNRSFMIRVASASASLSRGERFASLSVFMKSLILSSRQHTSVSALFQI